MTKTTVLLLKGSFSEMAAGIIQGGLKEELRILLHMGPKAARTAGKGTGGSVTVKITATGNKQTVGTGEAFQSAALPCVGTGVKTLNALKSEGNQGFYEKENLVETSKLQLHGVSQHRDHRARLQQAQTFRGGGRIIGDEPAFSFQQIATDGLFDIWSISEPHQFPCKVQSARISLCQSEEGVLWKSKSLRLELLQHSLETVLTNLKKGIQQTKHLRVKHLPVDQQMDVPV